MEGQIVAVTPDDARKAGDFSKPVELERHAGRWWIVDPPVFREFQQYAMVRAVKAA